MFLATLILSLALGLLCFYFQVVCQRILRREFAEDYFQSIVSANRLEFLSVQRSIEDSGATTHYPLLRLALRCDFLVLTYLLRNSSNVHQCFTLEERLLMLYFRTIFVQFSACHFLRWRENPAVLRLTAVLQYFANVVGQRVSAARFARLTVSDFLENS